MKKITILLIILILTGCVNVDADSLNSKLDDYLIDLTKTYDIRINNSTEYFSYYLPSDMQEIDGNKNAAIIIYNNSKAALNLNVKAIVNSEYYKDLVITDEGFFKNDKLVYERNGVYTKNDQTEASYLLKIYEDKGEYLVYLITNDICVYGATIKEELLPLIKHFFTIAKSVEIEREKIVSEYSNKDVIDYDKKQIDLFDYILPSAGYLSDLVEKDPNANISEELPIEEEETNIDENEEISEDEESE